MIVVDASVVVAVLVDHTDVGDRGRTRLSREAVAAPELIDLEVLSAIRRLLRTGEVTGDQADAAAVDLIDLPVERVAHKSLLPRCWQLRDNLTPYDASYIALAEIRDLPLVTLDDRLAKAPGPRCRIEVL